jgi:hypothetical protein
VRVSSWLHACDLRVSGSEGERNTRVRESKRKSERIEIQG